MPNDWHLMVWPQEDGALSQFVGWLTLTLTHTQRRHAHRRSAGSGHLYQGRFRGQEKVAGTVIGPWLHDRPHEMNGLWMKNRAD
jgi:hypothetical protein